MSREDEDQLVTQARGGDRTALERLLLRYAPRLEQRITAKIPIPLQSLVGADDILQETFVDVFRNIARFEQQGAWAFYRWLATIAESRLKDAIKAQQAAKRGGSRARQQQPEWWESADNLIDLLAGSVRSPSQSVAGREARLAVQVSLAALKNEYRRAIELRHIQGLTVNETAEEMGKTPDAVRNLCRRGLAELQTVLGRSSKYLSSN